MVIYKSQIDGRIFVFVHAGSHFCWHFNHCFASFVTSIALIADSSIDWRNSTELTKLHVKISESERYILPLKHSRIIGYGVRQNRRVFRFINFLLRFEI